MRPRPPRGPPSAPRRKLSFSEQQALKTLPGRIERLTGEIARLERQLSEADSYRRDPAGFAGASRALESARAERDLAEEEWLRVEMLREALESG